MEREGSGVVQAGGVKSAGVLVYGAMAAVMKGTGEPVKLTAEHYLQDLREYDRRLNLRDSSRWLYEHELKGGECFQCREKWVPVEVKNRFVEYTYYRAACSCFPFCPICGVYLFVEFKEGYARCLNCAYAPPCRNSVYQMVEVNGSERRRKGPCGGGMQLTETGYQCPKCNKAVSFEQVALQFGTFAKWAMKGGAG